MIFYSICTLFFISRYDRYKNVTAACEASKLNISSQISMSNQTTRTNFTSVACNRIKTFPDCCVHDPQLYYFYRKALNIAPSIEDSGAGMQWKLVGCLILSWVVVYACIVKGVKSSGKVSFI